MHLKLSLVVAMCQSNRGIGINGTLPWRLKGDMEFFRKTTTKCNAPGMRNAVLMGRKTWESIPPKMRPLKSRLNVVLSQSLEIPSSDDLLVARSFDEALDVLSSAKDVEHIFVIGGSSVYETAMKSEFCHRVYLTEVFKEHHCDTFFPEFDDNQLFRRTKMPWADASLTKDAEYEISCYQRIATEGSISDVFERIPVYMVVAMEKNRGIANKGELPWPIIGKDYKHYVDLLRGDENGPTVAIIGRSSWECMGEEKNLPDVLYLVVSRSQTLEDFPESFSVVKSFDEAVCMAADLVRERKAAKVCFLGGHFVYREAIERGLCRRIYLTRVLNDFPSDVFLPTFEHKYTLDGTTIEGEDRDATINEGGVEYKFEEYALKA